MSTRLYLSGRRVLTVVTKVYTTCGRSVEFPTPDDGGPSMKARAEDNGEIIIAFRPAFHKVVGFLARAVSSTDDSENEHNLTYVRRVPGEFKTWVWYKFWYDVGQEERFVTR